MATYKEIIGKKGKKYQVTVRIKGFQTIYKTFSTKTDARHWAEDVETQMRKGNYSKINKKENIKAIVLVSELIDDFKSNRAKKYSHPEKYVVIYEWWKSKIGHMNVVDIDSGTLTQCQNILSKEAPTKPYKEHKYKSDSTIRKYMFALSAVLKYAVRLGIIVRNPMSDVEKPSKPKGVVRFLNEEEKQILTDSCKKHSIDLFVFVVLAMFSGGRYNELRHLQVKEIDTKNSMIQFLETKNGESRGVPIDPKVMDMLLNYIKQKGVKKGYIFLNKRNNLIDFKAQYEKVVENSGIQNLRFHDLRHTYATWLAKNGAELLEIATLMGHKSLNQVRIYAHLTHKHTSQIVSRMTSNMLDFDLNL